MTRITFEGFDIDARSRDMLITAREICDAPLVITQGGYNAGGVTASAGTHDGGGALDIRATNLTDAQRLEAVKCLRIVGFAAWLRLPSEGDWPYHIHCIAMGCPDASAGAKHQMIAYENHRNGLANNNPDTGRPLYSGVSWESFAKGYFMSAAEVAELKSALGGKLDALQADFNGFQVLYSGRWAQEINEAREQAAALKALILAEDVDDDATEDGRSTLAGQRWAQTQDGVVALTGKLDALTAKVDAITPKA